MNGGRSFLLGIAAAIGGRALLNRLLMARFRRSVAALNAGDYGPLLDSYSQDAVLHFNDGDHRWAGEHRGKAAIEEFLREFVGAGLQGELEQLWTAGAPWSMTIAARFNDRATGANDELLYSNRVAMVLRTRWGKVVEHEDFYEDTGRILDFEQVLRERERLPV